MELILDFDDLHWKTPENCMVSIEYLVKRNPKIKLIFFTVPLLNNLPISLNKEFCSMLREYIKKDNIQLAIHGTTHSILEFKEKTYQDAINSITRSEEEMKIAELPFIKVFKGPHWGINNNTVRACVDLGYTHIFNHTDYLYLDNKVGLDFIYYNWNLKDDFLPINNIIYGHGHTHDVCSNGIYETKDKILKTIDTYQLTCRFL